MEGVSVSSANDVTVVAVFADKAVTKETRVVSGELHGNAESEPKIGLTFDGIEEMFECYKNYGKRMGFSVKKKSNRKNVEGNLRSVTFCCAREGTPKTTARNPLRPHVSMRSGCKARLSARLNMVGGWEISVLALEHNHELNPNISRFVQYHRKPKCKDRGGDKISTSSVNEAGGNEKDSGNMIEQLRRLQLCKGDAQALMTFFSKMVAENIGFYFDVELNHEDRPKNVFWADGRSREVYKEFGEVVMFDTTCLANKYDLPFISFVGVNHHGQSLLLGCGLISNEDAQTFVWIFSKWLACMSGCAPQGIVTDQDSAMQNAIEIIFPQTKHRWCLWHVMKKLLDKLGKFGEHQAISVALKDAVFDTQSQDNFEQRWNEVVGKYGLEECNWLSELYNQRHLWVPCFVKNTFWAGMSTAQQNESMKPFFDGCIQSKTTLKEFVEQYESALRKKVVKEMKDDAESFSKLIPTVTSYPIEKQVQGVYTISKFKEFQVEVIGKMYCDFLQIEEGPMVKRYVIREDVWLEDFNKRMTFTVSFDERDCAVHCSCQMFEFQGILCRHAVNVLIHNDVRLLPDKYILRRWRKDVKRSYSKVKVSFNCLGNDIESVRRNELCSSFSKIAEWGTANDEQYSHIKRWLAYLENELKLGGRSCI
ncbi:hypothetical protein MKW98_016924 [Papaver atlanticum]|uniref:Protein FAR1-RELATED SEQUENCE n=1 Tax=Papaver atlanticum TaxID=357466 RepID=A0AAD4XXR8_9MAGN|nr:hypothetical protein MKW98_016924 [Papaver atlanticum]